MGSRQSYLGQPFVRDKPLSRHSMGEDVARWDFPAVKNIIADRNMPAEIAVSIEQGWTQAGDGKQDPDPQGVLNTRKEGGEKRCSSSLHGG